MAVFQISRIQVRRGQILSGTGLPQLASGELAWAIDSQELYIGNGAVSEGSPAVGNTKILTLNDLSVNGNVLGFIQYVYKANDPTITTGIDANNPTTASIQDSLDREVTTLDFGASGDGSTDDTAALQRAIDQLFLNPSNYAYINTASGTSTRLMLKIPAGIFNTSDTLYLPSYTTLIGAGIDKTIINYNPVSTVTGSVTNTSATVLTTAATTSMIGATISGSGIVTGATVLSVVPNVSLVMSSNATATNASETITITLSKPAIQFINNSSTIGNPSVLGSTLGNTQPTGIQLSGLTVNAATGQNTCLQLDAVSHSLFEDIRLIGNWTTPATPNTLSKGILMQAVSNIVTCEENVFRHIRFTGFYYSVYAKQDILNNIFEDCYFDNARQAFALGAGSNGSTSGQQYGPRQTQINKCKFYNIKQHGVYLERGEYNTVSECKFNNVGNNGGGNITAVYPHVYFATYGNSSLNNQSDRNDGVTSANDLVINNITTPYVPELGGHGTYQSYATRQIILSQTSSPVIAFRLPVSTDQYGSPTGSINYNINYFYKSLSTNFTRSGTMLVTADVSNAKIQLSDEFNFAGNDVTNTTALVLDFSATFLTSTGSTYTGSAGQQPYSIAINYVNNLGGEAGYISYSYTAIL